MAPERQLISYAQNSEDVVLWRALGHLPCGRYVEVGANDPTEGSISRAFHDHGWSGIAIEPVPEFAEAFRRERPVDTVVQAAVTDGDTTSVTMHVIDGTGLSTLDTDVAERHRADGWTVREETVAARRLDDILAEHVPDGDDIHFMVIDVEGAEAAVLDSLDLRRWRPWVLVVEATAPNTMRPTHAAWEAKVLESGYVFCLFDGLSRFYVAEEHSPTLRASLGMPSHPLEGFVPYREHRLEQDVAALRARLTEVEEDRDRLRDDLVRWRGAVLARWTEAAAGGGLVEGKPTHEVVRLRTELAATQSTVSWRITAPLRAVQSRRLRGRL